MKKMLLGAIALLLAQPALAVFSKVPCTPLFVAGPQGRPLPDSVVSVADENGLAVTGSIYNNPQGTSLYPFTIPPSQIIQFYVDLAGPYQVTVTASGSSKTYWTICGFGSTGRVLSIDRTANELNDSLAGFEPIYTKSKNAKPDNWSFADSQVLTFDFVTPSFITTFSSMTLGTVTPNSQPASYDCNLAWTVNFCAYANGDAQCNVTAAANTAGVSLHMPLVQGIRTDFTFNAANWSSFQWSPGDHVVVSITKNAGGCELGVLDNVRLELAK